MADNDRFPEAERRYRDAKSRFERGQLSRAQFEEAIKSLALQDSQGRYWAIGALDGAWYVYAGQAWTRADPHGQPGPDMTGTPRRGGRPSRQAPSRRRRGGCGRVLLWLLGLVLVGALAYVLAPRLVAFLPGLRPGACAALVGSVRTEVAQGDQLTCTFGVADELHIEQAPSREVASQRLALYAQAQKDLVASLGQVEGFADRSSWLAEAAILDTRASLAGQPVFTRDGLLLYRERYLIQVRLTNWPDDAAMQRRWEELAQAARNLVDARFK